MVLYCVAIKRISYILGVGLIFSTIARFVYAHFGIAQIDILTNFDYFAFGSIPAYLLIKKPDFLNYIERIPLVVKYGIAFIAVLFPKHVLGNFTPFVLGCLFSALLIFTLPQKDAIKIDNKWWINKLGKYTYGMYLYHTIFILLINQIIQKTMGDVHWGFSSVLAFILTVIVSMVSYNMFEKPFLVLKKK